MCDGSLAKDKQTMILHTQSYSFEDNIKLSTFLNVQWGFQTQVIQHKDKYPVIKIPSSNSKLLKSLISKNVIESIVIQNTCLMINLLKLVISPPSSFNL